LYKKGADMTADVELTVVGTEGTEKARLALEVADTPEKRAAGLSGRTEVPGGQGMFFDKAGAYWMKGCHVPLDIAFINKEGEILEIQSMPLSDVRKIYRPDSEKAAHAIEVAAGWFDQTGVKPGDIVKVAELTKEAISAKLVSRALRARQFRNLAGRGLGKFRYKVKPEQLNRFAQSQSRTSIPKQLLAAIKGNTPEMAKVKARQTDPAQVQRVMGQLMNRTEQAPAGIMDRLRYAFGKGTLGGRDPKIDRSRLQRIRGGMVGGRGNLGLRDKKDWVKRKGSRMSAGRRETDFRTAGGHKLTLSGAANQPGLVNVDELSHTDFSDLSRSLNHQRLSGALNHNMGVGRFPITQGVLDDIKLNPGLKKDPQLAMKNMLKRLPNDEGAKLPELGARLSTTRRALPRSYGISTTPGHDQVRSLYQGHGFIPRRDGNMILPGGDWTVGRFGKHKGVDLARMYQSRRMIRTADPATLARLGINPATANVGSMIRDPKAVSSANRKLNLDLLKSTRSRDQLDALNQVTQPNYLFPNYHAERLQKAFGGKRKIRKLVDPVNLDQELKIPKAKGLRDYGMIDLVDDPAAQESLQKAIEVRRAAAAKGITELRERVLRGLPTGGPTAAPAMA
jgi:uncharacterized membrane protein (UPF0127 family)